MHRCSHCGFEAISQEQLAGHRSAHVRRGEMPKRIRNDTHRCHECGRTFETGWALGGHIQIHARPFSELKSSGMRKQRLIAQRGHRCETCGNTEWMGQSIPITLDHVDGNSQNNTEDNLRLLCPNCHAQTPTFCGKNVGRFPGGERYKAMKAYCSRLSESKSEVDGLPYKQEAAGPIPASPTIPSVPVTTTVVW